MKFMRIFLLMIASVFVLSACLSPDEVDVDPPDDDGEEKNDQTRPAAETDPEVSSTVPGLDGLEGDAGNEDLLYFLSTHDGDEGLYAVEPDAGQPNEVDSDIADPGATPVADRFLIAAGASRNDEELTDFRPDQVFYVQDEGQRKRVATDEAATDVSPEAFSAGPGPDKAPEHFILPDYEDPLGTAVAYRYDGRWYQLRLSDDDEQDALAFEEGHEVIMPLFNGNGDYQRGWLTLDEDGTIQEFDAELEHVGAPTEGGQEFEDVAAVKPFGPVRQDGSRYLAVVWEDEETGEPQSDSVLGLYEPESDGAGRIGSVRNPGGTLFRFFEYDSEAGFRFPADSQVAFDDEAVFFLTPENVLSGQPALMRIEFRDTELLRLIEDGEAVGDFLLRAGDRLVWSYDAGDGEGEVVESVTVEGKDPLLIDPNQVGSALDGPVRLGANDWVYYNRTDVIVAVAARTDGSERLEFGNRQWVGTSTSGHDAVPGPTIEALEPGEIFLSGQGSVAALDATEPDAGKVDLGNLPGNAEYARLMGIGPGPHRLLQTVEEGEPDSFEVIYVNTREEGSLQTVSFGPDTSENQSPVPGF